MMANESSQSLSLKVLVEKEKNQVVFAESNKDFVDVLFSFMTMPIATIITLARQHSLEVDIGCLNNLYESVENIDEEHLQSMECKDMLLHPRSAAEIYCTDLKLNFVNSNTKYYYACSKDHCFGPYLNARCYCGNSMSYAYSLNNHLCVPRDGGVFVKSTARFLITDDLLVKPLSTMTGLTLLSKFGATDRSTREEMTINIEKDKVMKLLICSLTSRTPFSETILEPAIDKKNFGFCHEKYDPRSMNQSQSAVDATKKETKIAVKLIINKSNNRALYVETRQDFVDLIVSFLTFPLGYLFQKFSCLSSRGCLGNLYKSIEALDVEEFFKSEEMKAILVDPDLTRGLALQKQLIPIEGASYPSYSTVSSLLSYLGPAFPSGENIIGQGFIKGPSLFMVTDDLTITPLSPISGISFIDKLNIPLSHILEQEVTMGEEEALRLLEAALVSKTALTDTFILQILSGKFKQLIHE
ncbi:uncharacterized protein LOC132294399 [Cornus florida]|uniref:uncharacterized protein LOC132294399 n=1 Tax=Cornus florida TaxID=4283 RepID=UPI002896D52C|nr:uncharacterized protein LOC132294399 [Cornus florida]